MYIFRVTLYLHGKPSLLSTTVSISYSLKHSYHSSPSPKKTHRICANPENNFTRRCSNNDQTIKQGMFIFLHLKRFKLKWGISQQLKSLTWCSITLSTIKPELIARFTSLNLRIWSNAGDKIKSLFYFLIERFPAPLSHWAAVGMWQCI